jgi:asparagine synthase (glutamine-hydrolysing)
MCGFVGYVVGNSKLVKNSTILTDAIETIHHRGPDNTGLWISEDGHTALAHKRLSILDLSERSNQPFEDDLNHLITVFNGEIYNYLALRDDLVMLGHSFSTNSDTEVISKGFAEWGSDIFCKLEGMFAIAIIDHKNNKIFLARDRAGEKPLFYSSKSKTFSFASEIKPFLKLNFVNNDIDYESLHHLFNRGYSPSSKSIYSEIAKLDAASYLEFNPTTGKCKINKFWSIKNQLHQANKLPHRSDGYLVGKLETLLEDAIDKQLNADVPVGMLLSGGLDSSLLVGLAARNHDNLNTFNVAFKEYPSFDESSHAKLMANSFNCNHHEIEASTIHPEMFGRLSEFYDEPMFDSSMLPTFLLSEAVSKHCKVAIGGDGGDELFGGYPHYSKLLRIKNQSHSVPYFIRSSLSRSLRHFMPSGFKGKKTLEFFGSDLGRGYPNIAEFYSTSEIGNIFNAKNVPLSHPNKLNASNNTHYIKDFIARATFHDFTHYLKEDILVKVDRASMAHSLEIRSPFLDKRIIEFAFLEVPSSKKVTTTHRKILLKKLAAKVLPKTFDYERKQGFSIPINSFLNNTIWHEYFYQKISDADPEIFNKNFIFKLLKSSGKYRNNGEKIAALVFFMCWVERYQPNF